MTLTDWLARLSAELDLDLDEGGLSEDDLRTVLDLARDAAHHVQRPAAPLTTFLVGVAVGRGAALSTTAARAATLAVGQDRADVEPDQN